MSSELFSDLLFENHDFGVAPRQLRNLTSKTKIIISTKTAIESWKKANKQKKQSYKVMAGEWESAGVYHSATALTFSRTLLVPN